MTVYGLKTLYAKTKYQFTLRHSKTIQSSIRLNVMS